MTDHDERDKVLEYLRKAQLPEIQADPRFHWHDFKHPDTDMEVHIRDMPDHFAEPRIMVTVFKNNWSWAFGVNSKTGEIVHQDKNAILRMGGPDGQNTEPNHPQYPEDQL